MSKDQLWQAIYEFFELMVRKEPGEAAYQELCERFPLVLSVLGCPLVKSYEKGSGHRLPGDQERGFRPEPDFIALDPTTGQLSVVDLKTPFVGRITTGRADGNRAKFTATAESYLSQVAEYLEFIRGSEEARRVICQDFGVERLAAYRAILVYGLAADNDMRLISELAARRVPPVEVQPFDRVFDHLVERYLDGGNDLPRRGWCFVFHLSIEPEQEHEKAYVASSGSGARDRLSVWLEQETVTFECVDGNGEVFRLSAPIEPGQPIYIRFEFASDDAGICMSLNVNNVEQDARLGKRPFALDPDFSEFTLGADSEGRNGANFFLMEHYSVNRTMQVHDKLGSYKYFKDKLNAREVRGMRFSHEQYMVRAPDGNLIQPNEAFRPTFQVRES